jgi:D-xylose transport system ATP-binding protein
VLVIGEGQLRGDFINEGLTQEQVLAAALSQSGDYLAAHNKNDNDRPGAVGEARQ